MLPTVDFSQIDSVPSCVVNWGLPQPPRPFFAGGILRQRWFSSSCSPGRRCLAHVRPQTPALPPRYGRRSVWSDVCRVLLRFSDCLRSVAFPPSVGAAVRCPGRGLAGLQSDLPAILWAGCCP